MSKVWGPSTYHGDALGGSRLRRRKVEIDMILDFGCLLEVVKEPATTRTGPIEPCEASLSACEGYDSLRLTTRGSSRDD